MNTQLEFKEPDDRIVYVKTVDMADLPDDVRDEIGDDIGEHDQLYAVYNSEGQQLALVGNRKLAFTLARQHDFAPVAVH